MIHVSSYAKINLILDVLAKRPDGYHELTMIMQSVSLADVLSIKSNTTQTINITTNIEITNNPTENLCYKAAQLIINKYQLSQGIDIHIEKNIPIAAGLAGGSADCAGTILGINALFDLQLSYEEQATIANTLGSDISFCLTGGTALASGRGEKIELLPAMPKLYGLLLKPLFGVSTAAVYRSIPKGIHKEPSPALLLYKNGQINEKNLANNITNDLYPYACALQPDISTFIQQLQKTKPLAVQMSGSGPTIFAFYNSESLRNNYLEKLKSPSYQLFPIETLNYGQVITKLST